MSRYIEIGKAMELCDEFYFSEETCSVKALFDSAPSIDIVRCRECRYWHSGECWGIPYRGDYDTSIDTKADDFCSYGNRSEKPNNCEHITEDGVTCAKYPACDDCLDNPLNKIKGSERLAKGSEQTERSNNADHIE